MVAATHQQVSANNRAETITAIARIVMGTCFMLFGLTKFLAIGGTIAFLTNYLPFPAVVFWLAIIIEIGLGLALVLGFQTRAAASFLAFYVVFIACVFHAVPTDRVQRDQFLKNFVMAGGFLYIAAMGPGAAALDNAKRKRG